MTYVWIILGILVALVVLRVLWVIGKIVFAFWMLKKGAKTFLEEVGKTAMAKQPDAINLVPTSGYTWKATGKFNDFTSTFTQLGFSDVGVYMIPELPNMVAQLWVKPGEKSYAIVYEHPKAGCWADIVSVYRNGDRYWATQRPPTGLDQAPNTRVTRCPDADAMALHEAFLRERPSGEMVSIDATNAVAVFQDAYATDNAWRKQQGISAQEVAHVAKNRIQKV